MAMANRSASLYPGMDLATITESGIDDNRPAAAERKNTGIAETPAGPALDPTLVWLLCLLPLAWLWWQAASGAYVNPEGEEALVRGAGDWALRACCA